MRPQRGLPEMLQVKNATTRPPGNIYLLVQAKMRPEKNVTPQGVAFLAFISYYHLKVDPQYLNWCTPFLCVS